MTDWINESLYPGWGQRFEVVRILAQERSEFQEIVVFESASHGRVLVLDGCVQITEADEFVYQEMIAHVPLLEHGFARRVLIIGAGDGGVLRRVLQHRTVEAATMVEIDGAVIRLAREFMPEIAGAAWDDPRARVIVGDGIRYVREAASGAYDVIIVDSTDPVGVGEPLFTEGFYAECARVLGPDGLIVNQSGVPFMQGEELRITTNNRRGAFANATAYLAAVPTYVGGAMAFGLASQSPKLGTASVEDIRKRASNAGVLGQARYWSPEVHAAAFKLPPYVSRLLGH